MSEEIPEREKIERLLKKYVGEEIEEVYMEENKMKLEQSYFKAEPEKVAMGLLGRYIICRQPNGAELRARLTEIAAYEGATKTTSKGTLWTGGIVSISTKFGQNLLDIATGKEGESSCVTLRGGEVELEGIVKECNGPGLLTKQLGITRENKNYYNGRSICSDQIWIEGDAVDASKIRTLKGNSGNCKGIYKI